MKNIFWAFLFLAAAVSVHAADAPKNDNRTIRFRAGEIYSAEISTKKPEFEKDRPYIFVPLAKPAWVELIVRFDKGRSFSVYDFTLDTPTKKYSCNAVALGEDKYIHAGAVWNLEAIDPSKFYRLLFQVDEPEQSIQVCPSYEMKFRLFSTSVPSAVVPCRNMLDGDFTSASKVPPEGLIGLRQDELPWNKKDSFAGDKTETAAPVATAQ